MAGGYCLLNHVAICAAYLLHQPPSPPRAPSSPILPRINRVLIVDWDIHHGNGTQKMFLDDPRVLFFSIHRYHSGNYYPFQGVSSGPTAVGVGPGAGYNINIGWQLPGGCWGDAEYQAAWHHVLMPVAHEFSPDAILVSAGFDGAAGDVGAGALTPAGYARLTRTLCRSGRPVVATLEGGYTAPVLASCVQAVVHELATEPVHDGNDEISLDDIDPMAASDIRKTIQAHRPFWKCFQS
jgi:acetoin utilization deacetylase AcuC-like enzyme